MACRPLYNYMSSLLSYIKPHYFRHQVLTKFKKEVLTQHRDGQPKPGDTT